MTETYNFIQPKYVSEFKCDGNKCNARCCRKWLVIVDDKALETYKKIESDKKEITSRISFLPERKINVMTLDKNDNCVFLTKENLCSLQLAHGEEILCVTCRNYPRRVTFFDGILETAMTLSCPVAAESALTLAESTKLEPVKKYSDPEKFTVNIPNIPPELHQYFLDIQFTAIDILKNKNLTINQRLAVLGIFLENIEDVENIDEKVFGAYKSENFSVETAQKILSNFTFNPREFIRVMFDGVIETLYGKKSSENPESLGEEEIFALNLAAHFNEVFRITPDENGTISVDAAAKSFLETENLRGEFLKKFEQIFENYLVNEFFMNVYPFRFDKSVTLNFGVFIATYKIIELFTLIMYKTSPQVTDKDLVNCIAKFSTSIDHTALYSEKILNELRGKNISQLITTFLQV